MKRARQVGRPRTMSQLLEETSSRSGSTGHSAHQSAQLPPSVPVDEQANRQLSKATRGQSKGIPEWNTNVKVHVQFNGANFQPVGERAGQLKSQLGQIVRNGHRVPLNIIDWKKVGDDVKEGIWEEVKESYEEKLRQEPEENQNLTSVKDRVFHALMGDDGHGYCRTFGSGVPHSLVYPKESNSSQSTADLIKEITEQVRQEFQTQLDQLHARIDFMQSRDSRDSATEPSRQVPDAISGHESLRESIGDGSTPNANNDQPSLEPGSPVTSPSPKNGSHRILMAKRAKQMKASAKLTK